MFFRLTLIQFIEILLFHLDCGLFQLITELLIANQLNFD